MCFIFKYFIRLCIFNKVTKPLYNFGSKYHSFIIMNVSLDILAIEEQAECGRFNYESERTDWTGFMHVIEPVRFLALVQIFLFKMNIFFIFFMIFLFKILFWETNIHFNKVELISSLFFIIKSIGFLCFSSFGSLKTKWLSCTGILVMQPWQEHSLTVLIFVKLLINLYCNNNFE